jgi:hypothetical protein
VPAVPVLPPLDVSGVAVDKDAAPDAQLLQLLKGTLEAAHASAGAAFPGDGAAGFLGEAGA